MITAESLMKTPEVLSLPVKQILEVPPIADGLCTRVAEEVGISKEAVFSTAQSVIKHFDSNEPIALISLSGLNAGYDWAKVLTGVMPEDSRLVLCEESQECPIEGTGVFNLVNEASDFRIRAEFQNVKIERAIYDAVLDGWLLEFDQLIISYDTCNISSVQYRQISGFLDIAFRGRSGCKILIETSTTNRGISSSTWQSKSCKVVAETVPFAKSAKILNAIYVGSRTMDGSRGNPHRVFTDWGIVQ